MLNTLLHNETVTIVRKTEGELDDYNTPTISEETHDIGGVNVQPISRATNEATRSGASQSSPVGGSGDLVTGRWLCSGPVDMDARAEDDLIWRGHRYTIEGYPQRFITDIGLCDHTELWLRRAEG